jgi:hypothetical protein
VCKAFCSNCSISVEIGNALINGITYAIGNGLSQVQDVVNAIMEGLGQPGLGAAATVGEGGGGSGNAGMTTNLNMGGLTFNTTIQDQMSEDEFTFRVLMAFFPVDRNANASNNVLEMKSILVRGIAVAEQLQRESAEMTEAQIQAQYGLTGLTQAAWNTTINGLVTALQAAAVENYISQLG